MKKELVLPQDYEYETRLETLDDTELKAKIMIDIFKELEKRHFENPNNCPWCKKELKD